MSDMGASTETLHRMKLELNKKYAVSEIWLVFDNEQSVHLATTTYIDAAETRDFLNLDYASLDMKQQAFVKKTLLVHEV